MENKISKLKIDFLEYLEIEKGRSIKTIENYSRYLNKFFSHSKIKYADDIDVAKIKEFRI